MRLLQRRETQSSPARAARGGKPVVVENRWRRLIRETRSELKKVTWPTREQTVRLTIIVSVVAIAVGIFLGGLDLIFQWLFQLLLGGV